MLWYTSQYMMGVFIPIISALYSFLFVTMHSFQSLSLSIIFISLSSIIFLLKKEKTIIDNILYGIILLLSSFISIFSNGTLTFLNFVAIFYFGSLLSLKDIERNNLHFFKTITLPFQLLINCLTIENVFPFKIKNLIKTKKIPVNKLQDIIITVIISFVVLFIVLPLLSSANPLFQKWVLSFINIFNIDDFLDLLFGQIMINGMRIFFFIIFYVLLTRLFSYIKLGKESTIKENDIQFPMTLPKILIAVILGIFFLSQYKLYFATDAVLKTLGLTNSQYAREVFAQLGVVALVILGLMYFDKLKKYAVKLLTVILLVEGVFLTGIALKSVYDYSSLFGFTFKRLYGFAGVVWIFGVFALFAYTYLKQLKGTSLLRNILLYSGIILILINVFNFDYLVNHVSKPRTGEGIDYNYLAYNISADGHLYRELFMRSYLDAKKTKEGMFIFPVPYLISKINKLREEYTTNDWRSFNVSEYIEYQDIKDKKLDPLLDIPTQ